MYILEWRYFRTLTLVKKKKKKKGLEWKLVRSPATIIDFICISTGGSSIYHFGELAFVVKSPSQPFSCPHLLYTLKTSLVLIKMDFFENSFF